MTRDEFIDGYVQRSGIADYRTPEGFHVPGTTPNLALPCSCGEEGCEGWAMIPDVDLGPVEWHMRRHGRTANQR